MSAAAALPGWPKEGCERGLSDFELQSVVQARCDAGQYYTRLTHGGKHTDFLRVLACLLV